ncbi:syndecan-2-like [Watersipora subatra]|uniref:syndecan-2-like n=1 Tax=Watersipora subatra TaxID=2589382 RepID=UPI00355B70AC
MIFIDKLLTGSIFLLCLTVFAKGQLDGSGSGDIGSGPEDIGSGGGEVISTSATITINIDNPDDEDDNDITISSGFSPEYSGEPEPDSRTYTRCLSQRGPCWCVDKRGQEIEGTMKADAPGLMNCPDPIFVIMPGPDDIPTWSHAKYDVTTPKKRNPTKKILLGRGGGSLETTTTGGSGSVNGRRGDEEVDAKKVLPLFTHPGILAAIIGGGVVALLCALLLVMFVIYRMRKKDEGSYPLGNSHMRPVPVYTRHPQKEFYA